jgi:N-acetylglucosamine malate deacetylase 1
MKPMLYPPGETRRLLAFGAHPDDIEFGAGAVIARETRAGAKAHFVVCSRGEAATNGTPAEREAEARRSAELLGATVEFVELGGDAHLTPGVTAALVLADLLRRHRPHWVLAPTPTPNQHPDHAAVGTLARDASRLARYGGVPELRGQTPHVIEQLLFYAVGPEGEPPGQTAVWIDVSEPAVIAAWTAAMAAHATQARSRDYADLQMTRARLLGLRAGVAHAQALFPSDPLLVSSLDQLGRGARRF